MTVPSPCISICVMDEATGYCKGCWRTMEEISAWLYLPDEQKKLVLEALERRKGTVRR